jgi:ubiquilin
MFGGANPTAPADTRPPRERFATQLQQIKEMGFHDEETILQILTQTNGNVNLAMEILFSSLGGN